MSGQRKRRQELAQARRDLVEWIDNELKWYVKDYINDRDYAFLRKNLIDVAQAHAMNVATIRASGD